MTAYEINQLRKEFSRLCLCETIEDCNELIDCYSEFLYQAIIRHHKEPVYSYADADAKMVVQMMFTKTLYLKKLVEGVVYKSKDNLILNNIIDPTIIASLIRTIYETVGVFNLIYRYSNPGDEKTILYCLWVISGFKYRQRFEKHAILKQSIDKLNFEKQQILSLISTLKNTALYKNLDDANQKIIDKQIKEKSFLLRFEGTTVIPLHWQQLITTMGIKTTHFDNIYTYFSLYSHPSNVAVFQFTDMFDKTSEPFKALTISNLLNFFSLISIFIADLIYLFPSTLKTYNSMSIRDQIVLNCYNTLQRGENYTINDAWKIID